MYNRAQAGLSPSSHEWHEKAMIPELHTQLESLVWGDTLESKGLPGRVAATVLRYLYALVRDIIAGQLTLRAMSLVYTTLLSVVPLVAFSFSVLKGLGVHNDLKPMLYQILAPLGQQGADITEDIILLVDNVKGGVLGGVSLAFFIFTAVSMVQKVEESFNHVWHVSKPRSLARRFSEYTVVLLVGPVVVVVALGMIASIRSNNLVQWLLTHESFGPVFVVASKFTPYLLITGVFIFLYMFIPNARVRFKAALIGGVAAGFIWATLGAIFAAFVVYTGSKQVIYGGFAIAITALFWLYLNWLVLLVGAQLAFYYQRPEYLRIGHREPELSNSMRECLALNIMYLVGKAFRNQDRNMSYDRITEMLRLPSIALTPVADRLEAEGLLVSTEKQALIPGREPSRMRIADILEVVRERGDTGSYRDPRWMPGIKALGEQLNEAVAGVASDKTLADLLDESEKTK
jgi:membrane protein